MTTTAVWKTVLSIADEQEIEIPKGAEIIHAGVQAKNFCIWYRCDPKAPKERRQIRIAGTGHPIPAGNWRHIASTFYGDDDSLVFHLFEHLA
jgi:hypothetical protein